MNIYTYFSLKDQSIYSSIYLVGVSHKYWQCHSWVAVSQTLKFLPLARVRNDIVYEPEASRQCHSLQEQEEEISMSARLPPRNDIVSIYVKPPLNKARKEILNVFLQWEMSLLTTFLIAIECHCHRLCK